MAKRNNDLQNAKFDGYVKSHIEVLTSSISELKQDMKDYDEKNVRALREIIDKIDVFRTDYGNLKYKVGGIAVAISIIITILMKILFK